MTSKSLLLISLGGLVVMPRPTLAELNPPPPSSSAVTLAQCYERAKRISETLGISEESIRLVEAQYRDKLGSILPHVDWIKSQFYQDSANAFGSGGSPLGGSSFLTVQPQSYFQLTQPLFSGFRDAATLAAAKSLRDQTRWTQQQTEQQLLSDVAAAFYAAHTLQNDLDVLRGTRQLTADRIIELRNRVNLGKARESEVLSAETQLASLDAQIQDTLRSVADARELLSFLTGVSSTTTLQDASRPPNIVSLEEALTRAIKRPDLLATEEWVRQAGYGVRYARGGYWPTLNFTGRYFTERIGFLSDVRWDATFFLDVPLFSGGSTRAQAQQARSQEITAQLTLARLRRDSQRQVRTAHAALQFAHAQTQAYEKAVKLAERNYRVQEREYRLGLINNLELLRVLTDTQDVRRQWLRSQAATQLNDIRLKVAMGEGL